MAQFLHALGHVVIFQNLVTQAIDFLTLIVLDVVKFQKLLTDVVVMTFDLTLRRFNHAAEHLRFDSHVLFKFEPVGNGAHSVAAENPKELIFHRKVEDGTSRVALSTRTAAELIVDTTRLVAFATDDAQTPGRHHLVM